MVLIVAGFSVASRLTRNEAASMDSSGFGGLGQGRHSRYGFSPAAADAARHEQSVRGAALIADQRQFHLEKFARELRDWHLYPDGTPKKMDENCPKNLRYDTEMSHANTPDRHDRLLTEISAHHDPRRVPEPGKHLRLKIPKVILQVQAFDQVPVNMRDAMEGIMTANPEFEHVYFSEREVGEWMMRESEGKYRGAYDALLPARNRREYFIYCYLAVNGGIYLDSGFDAGTLNFANAKVIDKDERFVGAINGKKLSHEFIAATPHHPIVEAAVQMVTDGVPRKHYGDKPDAITGDGLLSRAFLAVTNQKSISHSYTKDNLRLHRYVRATSCLIGAVELAPPEGSPAASSLKPNVHNVIFWTRYPNYGRDTRWYRSQDDDAEAAWHKKHVYGDHSCPFGLTLGQENDKKNEQPAWNQVLVDMAPVHAPTRTATTNQKIPRIIMQTNKADQVPKDLRKAMQTLIDINPEYEHRFYSDKRIRDFIQQHFEANVLDAFDAVIPGAYKSDLFRYCFLYVHGGVFVDGDAVAVRPLSELIKPNDEFVSAEDNGIGWVHNAFMAAVPRHQIVKRAIDMAVDKISRRDYGSNPLSITGPILLLEAFRSVVGNLAIRVGGYKGNVKLVPYARKGHCMVGSIKDNGHVLLWMRYPTYKSETRWYMRGKSYYDPMWHERRVFANNNKNRRRDAGPVGRAAGSTKKR